MPSLADDSKLKSGSKASLIISLIILAAVLLLFFIPDFISVDSPEESAEAAGGNGAVQRTAASESRPVEKPAPPKLQEKPKAPKRRPVQKTVRPAAGTKSSTVARESRVSYREGDLVAKAMESARRLSGDYADDRAYDPRKDQGEKLRTIDKELPEPVKPEEDKVADQSERSEKVDELTWKELRKGENKKLLMQVLKDSEVLAKDVPQESESSRFALQEFIAGLKIVITGKQAALQASEVPAFLSQLNLEVTDAMLADQVPEDIYQRWARIDLGETLETVEARAKRKGNMKPFEPLIILGSVEVKQQYKKKGVFDPSLKTFLTLRGGVKSEQLKEIKLYINGKFERKVRVQRRVDERGLRPFRLRLSNNVKNSVFTFRAIDENGRIFEKSYTFFPRVTKFAWNGFGDGTFRIPFRDYDPGLDEFFSLGSSKRGQQEQGGIGLTTF